MESGFFCLWGRRSVLRRGRLQLGPAGFHGAKKLRGQISSTYARAYVALQRANITLGVIEDIENGISKPGMMMFFRALARLWVFLMALARR